MDMAANEDVLLVLFVIVRNVLERDRTTGSEGSCRLYLPNRLLPVKRSMIMERMPYPRDARMARHEGFPSFALLSVCGTMMIWKARRTAWALFDIPNFV